MERLNKLDKALIFFVQHLLCALKEHSLGSNSLLVRSTKNCFFEKMSETTREDDDAMTTSSAGVGVESAALEHHHSENDKQYFNSYFDCGVHELMIKDKPRTDGYLNAIIENSHVFKDKVVLGM